MHQVALDDLTKEEKPDIQVPTLEKPPKVFVAPSKIRKGNSFSRHQPTRLLDPTTPVRRPPRYHNALPTPVCSSEVFF